jgi:hypothetical protein
LTYVKRNRTSAKDIGYALYLYFLGLSSYRNTSKALSRFIRRNVMSSSGNGFNTTTNQKEYLSKEGKYLNL